MPKKFRNSPIETGELWSTSPPVKEQLSLNSSQFLPCRNVDTVLLDLPSLKTSRSSELTYKTLPIFTQWQPIHSFLYTGQPNKIRLLSELSPWSTSLTSSGLVGRHGLQSKTEFCVLTSPILHRPAQEGLGELLVFDIV